MLTEHERRFMDLYLREGFTHDYEGRAHRDSWARGITYDHYVRLYPFYEEAWRTLGEWPDHLPPLPDDPDLPCPWDSREQLEARIAGLESLVSCR
jgi:hypothetical protein